MSQSPLPYLIRKNALIQQLIIGAWGVGIAIIIFFWILSAQGQFSTITPLIGAVARLLGLLATYAALTQLLLMGRIWWIERPFGLDTLAQFHRINGYVALLGIIAHATLIVLWHSLMSGRNFFAEYLATIQDYQYVILASIAQLLFIAVVASSIYIARKRLKFESWYYVHLLAYLAITLAALHQFTIGTTLLTTPAATLFWYGLYGFVALNLLIWRFGQPVLRVLTSDYRIENIVAETDTVTSVYIAPRRGNGFGVIPGQFVLVRFLQKGFWAQEHPFTVSQIVSDGHLRLSIRSSGDYTATIGQLRAGTRVVVSGPLGRFTAEKAVTKKRLFIAGGIGITPLLVMAQQAQAQGLDSIVLYANRTSNDVPLKNELDALKAARFTIVYVYSDDEQANAERGYVDTALLKKYVPDIISRDVYLCGPPPMMAGVEKSLAELNASPTRIHSEKFALHP